jgi:hypothetical protein
LVIIITTNEISGTEVNMDVINRLITEILRLYPSNLMYFNAERNLLFSKNEATATATATTTSTITTMTTTATTNPIQ